ncbi:YqaA family protein [Roseobacter sp. HKCCA0434]|uniref:YqaA family protein n=1 Tax=Roseobacter sp. HKCCA0434 TaxID=3079297 RepID=UPI002905EAEE|nr:YqaA family protein [Roseobacter sp. HKCCA0434]
MLRRLYDWTLSLAEHRHALWVLAAVAFAESSFFPIPPHVLIIPMVLAAPSRAWLIAGVCTLASVTGGAFGYFIGASLYESVALPILDLYHKTALFEDFARRYNDQGAWAVLFAGLTPFPYKIITIASGATGLNFATFMVASIIARGTIFFVIAGLLWQFGEPIRGFIERRLAWLFVLFLVLLIGGFYVLRFL